MSDQPVTTQDYVRAALAGDAVKAQEIFSQLMAPRVVDAIDQQRMEVARNYFGQQPEAETETEQAVEDEQEASEEDVTVAQEQEQEEESHEDA